MPKDIKPQEAPINILPPLEDIAGAILKLSDVGRQIQQSKLTQKAVLILMQDMCKMPRRDIEIVLHNLPLLAKQYLKPEQPTQKKG